MIFHIDMDSYFASVEQQANPALIGKNIVVSGKEGSRTVIVAASKEAKRFGVKTAMATFQARKLCPDLIFVEPDGKKYWEVNRKFVEIFERFTDKVELFSIDEAFLDMTGYAKTFSEAREKALSIKKMMRQEIGEVVTCSFGIARNKFLAKLGSDLNKPDGIVVINEKNKINVLNRCQLSDFCGIGRRIESRLEMMGIETVLKLREYPLEHLIKEFGPFYGQKLRSMANGEDDALVLSENSQVAKSVSRAYTMSSDTFNKKDILQLLLILSEKCGRELRSSGQAGKTVEIFFRYDDFSHASLRVTSTGYISDGLQIYKIGERKILNFRLPKAVRLVGVRVSNLVENYTQLPLWHIERKRFQLVSSLDKINDKYGEFTIKPGFLLKSKRLRDKIGGFKFETD